MNHLMERIQAKNLFRTKVRTRVADPHQGAGLAGLKSEHLLQAETFVSHTFVKVTKGNIAFLL